MKRILCSLLIILALAAPARPASPAAQTVTVKETADGAQTRASETAAWNDIDKQASVVPGATVKTNASAHAVLTWFDGYVLRIDPLTILEITTVEAMGETRKTHLKMTKGRIVARAPKLKGKDSEFTIQTPTAVTGVRGTAFEILITEDNQTIVTCIEDAVFVAAESSEVLLDPGFSTMVLPDMPPAEPEPVPQELLEQLQQQVEEITPPESDAAIPEETIPADDNADAAADQAAEQATENVKEIIQDVIDDAVDDAVDHSADDMDQNFPY